MASPYRTTYFEAEPGGLVSITILELTPGRNYDVPRPFKLFQSESSGAQSGSHKSHRSARLSPSKVYCYSETYLPPSETGVDTAPRFGMDAESILNTRTRFITEGPFFDDAESAFTPCCCARCAGRDVQKLAPVIFPARDCVPVRIWAGPACPDTLVMSLVCWGSG